MKEKKLLQWTCVIGCVAIICMVAIACGNNSVHTCAYTEYGYNETEHWKYCPYDDTIDPDSYEEHCKSGTCVCGYVVSDKDSHTCAYTKYGHDDIRHWKYCPYDDNIDPASYESHCESGMCVCGYLVPFKSKLKYTFTGNEKDRSGYAEGSVEIVPIDGVKSDAIYELYWGDDRGVFKDYYSLGSGKGQGDSLTISIGENIMIPSRATKIYAAENKKVIAATDIPAEKRYNKTPELVFGSVSDVHVNYSEGADFWTNALNEYQKSGARYIIISGDLTSDGSDAQFEKYKSATERSSYTGLIFSSIGNHEQQYAGRANAFRYAIYDGDGKNWVSLDEAQEYFAEEYNGTLNVSVEWFDAEGGANTYYYDALIENNLYIFMDQMLSATGNSSNQDNFSSIQLDWVENLLNMYSGTHIVGDDFQYETYNLNIVEHALIKNYSAGDKYNGSYSQPIKIQDGYPNIKRFVSLLEEYNEAIWMSGHTHLGFTTSVDFVDRVYGMDGVLTDTPTARSVHNSSVAQARWYDGNSIIYKETYESGSEGYVCYQYADDIVFEGIGFKEYTPGNTNWQRAMQHKVFARANFIMPVMANTHEVKHAHLFGRTETKEPTASESGYVRTYCALCGEMMSESILTFGKPQALASLSGSGTRNDAIKISSGADWSAFVCWVKSTTPVSADMQSEKSYAHAGNGLYFEQTADINITDKSDLFLYADKYYAFAGSYNGNGYKLNIDVTISDDAYNRMCVLPVISGRLYNLSIDGNLKVQNIQKTVSLLMGISKGGIVENCLTTVNIFVYGTPTPSYLCPVCGDNAIVRNIWIGGSINTRSGNAQDGYLIETCGKNAQISSVWCKLTNGSMHSANGLTVISASGSRKDAVIGLEKNRTENTDTYSGDWLPIQYKDSAISFNRGL